MNPIAPTAFAGPTVVPPVTPDAVTEAVRIGRSGDLDTAASFVRNNPALRETVEDAMRRDNNLGGIFGLAERLTQGAQSLIESAHDLLRGIEAPPPVVGIDSPGWPTPTAAAKDALRSINPTSIGQNREYGGYIFETAEGTYGWTVPARGSKTGVDVSRSDLPPGVKIVGVYHTHGDYTETLPSGETRRTSPERDETNADEFSLVDLLGAHEGIQEYLGTPSGDFLWYNPDSKEIYTL